MSFSVVARHDGGSAFVRQWPTIEVSIKTMLQSGLDIIAVITHRFPTK